MELYKTPASYSSEIDGLRAIAILSVLIFHIGFEQLSGGFIGVDVFFVISGFLITRILITQFNSGTFEFRTFYARRARRLLPAALIMVVVTLVAGFFILYPEEYRTLAKSAAHSLLFLANVFFMNNSGYFDLSSDVSPLVHMWSLSVEEQYYFLFPIVLLLLHRRFSNRGVFFGLIIIATGSFTINIAVSHFPNISFYMLFTRAWELCLGGLVLFLPVPSSFNKITKEVFSSIAVFLLFYGFWFIGEDNLYPYYWALIPTLAASILIYMSLANSHLLKLILGNPVSIFVGKISYSTYLWHWPVVVYYRIYSSKEGFTAVESMLLLSISLLLGYLSWLFVEEKFRYREAPPSQVLTRYGKLVGLAFLVPVIILATRGFKSRVPSELLAVTQPKQMWAMNCDGKAKLFSEREYCVVGKDWDDAKFKGVIWGDSHSQHWAPVFQQLIKNKNAAFLVGPLICPPHLDSEVVTTNYPKYPNFTEDCTHQNDLMLEWIASNQKLDLIVMAAAWSGHDSMFQPVEMTITATTEVALRHLLQNEALNQTEILLISDIPRLKTPLNNCSVSSKTPLLRSDCTHLADNIDAARVRDWHYNSDNAIRLLAEEYDFVSSIIPTDVLCNEIACNTTINNEFIYKDTNHIRRNLDSQTLEVLGRDLGLKTLLDERITLVTTD
ncbi:MAG: acyltransferase family protein [Kangiellaceae bacterium]|jgi:peptidoglycan/LPS O-acetylase OafA/YrhL|nr:acyltransferase family protein [Kangiellaceae bacterium]